MQVSFTTFDAPDFVGGPNSWLRRIMPFLLRAGWRVRVYFFIEGGPPERCPCYRALAAMGVECKAISGVESPFTQVRWLLEELARSPPAVLVANLASAGYLAARWLTRAGIPAVGILHSDDPYYEKIRREFVLGPPGNRVSDMVCVSEYLARTASDAPTATRIHFIPYGVPIPERIARPPAGRLRLIYVGRLVEEQKRILEVTRALCRVVREVENTEAILYGNGPDRSRVERRLRQEGVGERVRLGGQVDNADMQAAILDAHILVLLSDYEGLPIALLEGMACGLVPVCLRIRSGVGELVAHGRTGVLVDDRGDDFVAAIRAIAADPVAWTRMSRAARERVAASYSDECNAAQWLQLLSERARRAPRPQAAKRVLSRGIGTLEFLGRTVAAHNARVMKPT